MYILILSCSDRDVCFSLCSDNSTIKAAADNPILIKAVPTIVGHCCRPPRSRRLQFQELKAAVAAAVVAAAPRSARTVATEPTIELHSDTIEAG